MKHPELVFAGAVALCLPMLPGLLHGNVSATAATIRFLIALVACWAFGGIIGWVVTTYGEQSRKSQIVRAIEDAQRAEADTKTLTNQESTT